MYIAQKLTKQLCLFVSSFLGVICCLYCLFAAAQGIGDGLEHARSLAAFEEMLDILVIRLVRPPYYEITLYLFYTTLY